MSAMSKSITLSESKLVVARYHMVPYQSSSDHTAQWFASTLFVDGTEAHETVALNTGRHNLQSGMYVGVLAAGSHSFATKYRTSASYVGYNNPSNWWQTRSMQILEFPADVSTAHNVNGLSDFTVVTGQGSWTDLNGMSKTITLSGSMMVMTRYHIASYQSSLGHTTEWFAATLFVDGTEAHDQVVLETGRHEHQSGIWVGELGAGDHTFVVKYRTSASYVGYNNPSNWWQTRSMQVVELPW